VSWLDPILPRHCPTLGYGAYVAYLKGCLSGKAEEASQLKAIWSPFFEGCQVIPTPNGREALWCFLEHAGLQAGDEVLVAAYNYFVVVQILVQRGLVPVFVDIEEDTLCMDPEDLKRKISDKSRLVLATHMFGNPANIEAINAICEENELMLFEDCAHAVGTQFGAQHAGSWGQGALFSFGVYKSVNAFGGGMLVIADTPQSPQIPLETPSYVPRLQGLNESLIRCVVSGLLGPKLHTWVFQPGLAAMEYIYPTVAQKVDPVRNDPDYRFVPGRRASFRPFMTEMLALQLDELESTVEKRRAIVQQVKSELADVDDITFLNEGKHGRANYSYFGVHVPDSDAMAEHLQSQRILSCAHEFYDCSTLPQFSDHHSHCPVAARVNQRLIRLPSYASMGQRDVARLVAGLRTGLA
jgi:dTDP-4-amino-4,6-dideoxygalactose transaminase